MSTDVLPLRPSLGQRLLGAVANFVSAPASPRPLAALRIGVAVVLLGQALALAPYLQELYGRQGIVQWPLIERMATDGVPRVGWVAELLAPLGISPEASLRLVFIVYLTALGPLLVGWHTRLAAVVAWLTHLSLNVSGTIGIYGVDHFAHIALFYCAVLPVGAAWSLDVKAGRLREEATALARLGLRLLQLHLAMSYLAAGLEKAVGEQWWTGEAVWRAVTQPDLMQFDMTWLASWPRLAQLGCWGTLVIEIGYIVFVWPRVTRRAWVLATIGLHVGIGVTMGLVSFSAMMIVLNVAAFLVPAEPRQ